MALPSATYRTIVKRLNATSARAQRSLRPCERTIRSFVNSSVTGVHARGATAPAVAVG